MSVLVETNDAVTHDVNNRETRSRVHKEIVLPSQVFFKTIVKLKVHLKNNSYYHILFLHLSVIIFLNLGWFFRDDFKLDKAKQILQDLLSYTFIIVIGAICRALNTMVAFAYK